MATSFTLLEDDIPYNPDGWGPTTVPSQYADIPFAPYEKRAYIGRMADWSARAEQQREQRLARGGKVREAANEAFTAVVDDTEGFELVDTRQAAPTQQWDKGMRGRGRGGRFGGRGRGRTSAAAATGEEAKFNAKFLGKKALPIAPMSKWKKNQQANYQGASRWNDQTPVRTRDASVDVRAEWVVKGQVAFPELQKMNLDPPAGEDVYTCGQVHYYDKQFDRITPKSEKALVGTEASFYKVSTSDDPVIARLHSDPANKDVRVYATDAILAVIMAAPRSSYSWDLVVNRVGDKLFLDKRRGSSIDFVTNMETANDFGDDDRDSINNSGQLMREATYINEAFSQQVLVKGDKPVAFDEPRGPFAQHPEEPVAPVCYRYRKFTLGKPPKEGDEDKRVSVLCRCEVDGVMKGMHEEDLFLRLYALNEVDSKLAGGIDWRQKLDSQRGAVLANELKNNSNKLAKWTVQALLSNADLIKFGYVSRMNPKATDSHVLLGTNVYKPRELAPLINLNMSNAWGILKAIVDLCLGLEEGKYLMLKDPNKPVVRFYSVPTDAFDEAEEPEPLPDEDDDGGF